MKLFLECTAVILIASVLGIGSAIYVVRHPPEDLTINNGPWRTSLELGSEENSIYIRSTVALSSLFALNRKETIYYAARTDSDNEPLRSDCDYRVDGRDLEARWWSITLYGEDFFLVPNNKHKYAYNGKTVVRNRDGGYLIDISRNEQGANWLPPGDDDQFYLVLRLYNPAQIVYEKTGEIELPQIIRGECR